MGTNETKPSLIEEHHSRMRYGAGDTFRRGNTHQNCSIWLIKDNILGKIKFANKRFFSQLGAHLDPNKVCHTSK